MTFYTTCVLVLTDNGGEDLAAARIELEQLRLRVAELESKLSISKKHQGLMFTVRRPFLGWFSEEDGCVD